VSNWVYDGRENFLGERLPAEGCVSGTLRSGSLHQGAEASYAWAAVFIPGLGWTHFDPTNDVLPSDGHITPAWGRDSGAVAPLQGITLGGLDRTIEVTVQVQPFESRSRACRRRTSAPLRPRHVQGLPAQLRRPVEHQCAAWPSA
jgi:hypothetical protein